MGRYTTKFFRDALPDYKRKGDPLLVRWVHRPLSFTAASLFSNAGISANVVSGISICVGLLASVSFLFNSSIAYFVGALLANIWMVLDCADGNIARAVKGQPMGEFVDAIGGYVIIGFLYICLGVPAYVNDGLLIPHGNYWLVFLAGLASLCDIMARLFFQKFRCRAFEESIEMQFSSKGEQGSGTLAKLRKIEERMDKEIGINGLTLIMLFVAAAIHCFDIMILFYASYNMLKLLGTLLLLMYKVRGLNSK